MHRLIANNMYKEIENIFANNWDNWDSDNEIDDIVYYPEDDEYVVYFSECTVTDEDYEDYLEETPQYALDKSDYFYSNVNEYEWTVPKFLNEKLRKFDI